MEVSLEDVAAKDCDIEDDNDGVPLLLKVEDWLSDFVPISVCEGVAVSVCVLVWQCEGVDSTRSNLHRCITSWTVRMVRDAFTPPSAAR